MTDEVVTRLYRCLAEELRARGHSGDDPLTVSDIYEDLVPYQAVRSALGVELKADYEHALLRLLAGERDLLRLEPDEARDELRREAEAPYPFVGLFRNFATSTVHVTHPAEASGSEDGHGPRANESVRTPAPLRGDPPAGIVPIAAEGDERPLRVGRRGGPVPARSPAPVHILRDAEADSDPVERLTHAGADCVFCEDHLPAGRRVRFCPHCGGDQRLRPCPRCEAVLERGWRYCISCGHEA